MSTLINPSNAAAKEAANAADISNIGSVFGDSSLQDIYDSSMMFNETEGMDPGPDATLGNSPMVTVKDVVNYGGGEISPDEANISSEMSPHTLFPGFEKNINVGTVSGVMGSSPIFSAPGFVFPQGAYEMRKAALVKAAKQAEENRRKIILAMMPTTASQYQDQINEVGFNILNKHLEENGWDWTKIQNTKSKEGLKFWEETAKHQAVARDLISDVAIADQVIADSLDTNKTVPDYVRNAAINFKAGMQDVSEIFDDPKKYNAQRAKLRSYTNLVSVVSSDKFKPLFQTSIAGMLDEELEKAATDPKLAKKFNNAYRLRRDTGSNELYTKALLESIPEDRLKDLALQMKNSYTLNENEDEILQTLKAYYGNGKWTLDENILSKVDAAAQARELAAKRGPEVKPVTEPLFSSLRNVTTDEKTGKPLPNVVSAINGMIGQTPDQIKKSLGDLFIKSGKLDGTGEVRYDINVGPEYKADVNFTASDPAFMIHDVKKGSFVQSQSWADSRTGENGEYLAPEGLTKQQQEGEKFIFDQIRLNGDMPLRQQRITGELQGPDGIVTYDDISKGNVATNDMYQTVTEEFRPVKEVPALDENGDPIKDKDGVVKMVKKAMVNAPQIIHVSDLRQQGSVDFLNNRVAKANMQGKADQMGVKQDGSSGVVTNEFEAQ